jgi:dolichol-phosphate mannosyltransferase
MRSPLAIDIVIPVYNEGGNIERTLAALAEHAAAVAPELAAFRVNLIYDFEEDTTLPVVRRMMSGYPLPLRLVRNPVRGVVNALKTGLTDSSADYVLVSMADMSDDYSILPELVRLATEGYDIVCPSRYMAGGRLHGGPFVKQLLSRLAGLSMHWAAGVPTHDITNSYKLYSRALFNQMSLESRGGFEIGMEITAKAYLAGARIAELPTQWWDRTEGKSNFKLAKWLPKYLKWYFLLLRSGRKQPTKSQ